ncbi:1,4-alpha-glucan branching protein GlgB [Planococcus sp. ISL-109]|uniref:1,4-alpha-glucan branching protein GlgB n=1 Tax=Planococcus sp. ISL-109 TaxID=2819166 RepID=UPI001BE98AC5|nr:1,4-alpha-glucan branching protein GlgB [Planococcus sp. ISL-109]MBT2581441.1 1,4-alpha-glucan branching protein GlgB [Planococcus sp. ISL-109]
MEFLLSTWTDERLQAFHEGRMVDGYLYFGAHATGVETTFSVWAPDIAGIDVVCVHPKTEETSTYPLKQHPNDTSIWGVSIPEDLTGWLYEYALRTPRGEVLWKSDPYAQKSETRPFTKSIVSGFGEYQWPLEVLKRKQTLNERHLERPMAIYEVHIGTWKRNKDGGFLTYRELADKLIPYVLYMGFTHIEILPITEHPLDESWGYQTTGFFSPTGRYGTADDLRYFVTACTEHGIGLILDWVPGHFCVDMHGLASFNGQMLYEEAREERRMNPDWGTLNFDINKGEVVSFILSSGHYWLEEFKFDGYRMDALVNLLFIPNIKERPHNEEGAEFLRTLTSSLKQHYPEKLLIAEDAWHFPKVTHPVEDGGVGFDYKWNFGWMNDTLEYMKTPPEERSKAHGKMNFSMMYQYEERYQVAFSHDTVADGRKSLLNKLPGTFEERFRQLRLLLGFWMAHPGKKLLFMGQEYGHFDEWEFQPELDWQSLEKPEHKVIAVFTRELLAFYRNERAFFELDDERDGFMWLDADNHEQSVASFIRRGFLPEDECIVLCNFSSRHYERFQVGAPRKGLYEEIFSTNLTQFDGTAPHLQQAAESLDVPCDNQHFSLELDLPPFTMSIWKKRKDGSDAL